MAPEISGGRPGFAGDGLEFASLLLHHHEGVIVVFGQLRVQIGVAAEGILRLLDLLEGRVLGAHLVIGRFGRIEGRRQDVLRQRAQLRAARNQRFERRRVLPVVAGKHVGVGNCW